MIKTIIVDDDHFQIELLRLMLSEHFKQVDIIATSQNVTDAVNQIDELKPQLVFLDIEMGIYSGFDLLEMVAKRDFEVVFTTNFQKYAVQAIKVSALDYIEKPILKASLGEALLRYKGKADNVKMLNLLANFSLNEEEKRIALPDKNGLSFFEVKNIVRCKSDNSYTEFYILGENSNTYPIIKMVVSKGFNEFEDFLVERGFFYRVHNQHIVNINHIRKYVKDDGGYLIMDDRSGVAIPIARSRKEEFLIYLQSKGIIL